MEKTDQNKEMKECFIITPIGGASSDIRREIDGLTKSVLEPVLKEHDFKPVPAHEISETGSISRQMMKHLLDDELIIANLTELNPNVMYEVGIRHCTRKPLIVLAREGTKLPFDLSDERTIFYRNDIAGSEDLKQVLSSMIPNALKDEKPDNPVYRVVDVELIKLPEGTTDAEVVADKRFALIEQQLDGIQSAIRALPSNGRTKSHGLLTRALKIDKYPYKVSFYVKESQSDAISSLSELCDKVNIPYDIVRVYKNVEKFTAFGESEMVLSAVTEFGEVLGLEVLG